MGFFQSDIQIFFFGWTILSHRFVGENYHFAVIIILLTHVGVLCRIYIDFCSTPNSIVSKPKRGPQEQFHQSLRCGPKPGLGHSGTGWGNCCGNQPTHHRPTTTTIRVLYSCKFANRLSQSCEFLIFPLTSQEWGNGLWIFFLKIIISIDQNSSVCDRRSPTLPNNSWVSYLRKWMPFISTKRPRSLSLTPPTDLAFYGGLASAISNTERELREMLLSFVQAPLPGTV